MAVSASPEVVIKDACILFDLIDLGLLDNFYRLKLVVVTTPAVIAEILDATQLTQVQVYINSGQLLIDTSGIQGDIDQIVWANPGLSFTDASVLDLASRRKVTILSSDQALRKESQKRGLTVRGLLWIIEQMHVEQILAVDAMIGKLKEYQTLNNWAPKSLIETLIKKYTP